LADRERAPTPAERERVAPVSASRNGPVLRVRCTKDGAGNSVVLFWDDLIAPLAPGTACRAFLIAALRPLTHLCGVRADRQDASPSHTVWFAYMVDHIVDASERRGRVEIQVGSGCGAQMHRICPSTSPGGVSLHSPTEWLGRGFIMRLSAIHPAPYVSRTSGHL